MFSLAKKFTIKILKIFDSISLSSKHIRFRRLVPYLLLIVCCFCYFFAPFLPLFVVLPVFVGLCCFLLFCDVFAVCLQNFLFFWAKIITWGVFFCSWIVCKIFSIKIDPLLVLYFFANFLLFVSVKKNFFAITVSEK